MSLRRIWKSALRHFGLASLLLLMVAITHIAYSGIATLYDEPLRAAKAWHSVLRAFPESTLLYLMVWNLTPWEPISRRLGVSLVCFLGACASFQIAMCRVAFPMDKPPPALELDQGMCDKATGLPIYMLILGAIVVLLVTFLMKRKKKATQ